MRRIIEKKKAKFQTTYVVDLVELFILPTKSLIPYWLRCLNPTPVIQVSWSILQNMFHKPNILYEVQGFTLIVEKFALLLLLLETFHKNICHAQTFPKILLVKTENLKNVQFD